MRAGEGRGKWVRMEGQGNEIEGKSGLNICCRIIKMYAATNVWIMVVFAEE